MTKEFDVTSLPSVAVKSPDVSGSSDRCTATVVPQELMRLSARAAEGPWFVRKIPTKSGLAVIEDGREYGMFPVKGEWHEIEFIVAAANFVRDLIAQHSDVPPQSDPAFPMSEAKEGTNG